MGRLKHTAKKRRLIKVAKKVASPLWTSIRKYGLKRAQTRRIQRKSRNWRSSHKIQV